MITLSAHRKAAWPKGASRAAQPVATLIKLASVVLHGLPGQGPSAREGRNGVFVGAC